MLIFSLNDFTEEFVVKSLSASPFMSPFMTPGGYTGKSLLV